MSLRVDKPFRRRIFVNWFQIIDLTQLDEKLVFRSGGFGIIPREKGDTVDEDARVSTFIYGNGRRAE